MTTPNRKYRSFTMYFISYFISSVARKKKSEFGDSLQFFSSISTLGWSDPNYAFASEMFHGCNPVEILLQKAFTSIVNLGYSSEMFETRYGTPLSVHHQDYPDENSRYLLFNSDLPKKNRSSRFDRSIVRLWKLAYLNKRYNSKKKKKNK